MKPKIIYLAAHEANHPNYEITYQDINGKRDIDGDMMDVDLTPYDIIIATPPCNYWSIANYRRETSEYSQKTKHLLPKILEKLAFQDKPFIIENVRNYKLFQKNGLFDYPVYIYEYGRHTIWTNVPFIIKPTKDDSFNYKKDSKGNWNVFASKNARQGGKQVHSIINYWLEVVHSGNNANNFGT